MTKEIWVYSEKSSVRLNYVLNFISQVWEIQLHVCHELDQFKAIDKAKLNYSNLDLDVIQIIPHEILFKDKIENFDFPSLEKDDFSMIFFLLSRYEEYIIKDKDQHGRFQPESSYLFKTNRLHTPWVDVLLGNLKQKIKLKYPEITFKSDLVETQLTIDIDQAFMMKNKSLKRWMGGNLRDLFYMNYKNLKLRNQVYLNFVKDPWDVYDEIKNHAINFVNPPIFFFQIGNYAEFDKNLSFKNKKFTELIKHVSTWAKVGLHPSYQSNEDFNLLLDEKVRLENILGKPVQNSRQHYIKLSLPKTYKNLLNLGIKNDYSMGYAQQTGFRAGTSHSFFWYDLMQELETELKIHPFCAMDVTLKNYLNFTPNQANEHLKMLYQNIEGLDGKFRIICHNESLSGYDQWQNWPKVFLSFFKTDK